MRSSSALSSGLSNRIAEAQQGGLGRLELDPVAGSGHRRRGCARLGQAGRPRLQRRDQPVEPLARLGRDLDALAARPARAPNRSCSIRNKAQKNAVALLALRRDLAIACSAASATSGAVASTSHNTRSASSTRANARLIPSASTLPRASRIPAVSTRITGMPPRSRCTSMTSRVVPASSETIATSRLASAFSRDDLPALGGPAMTMRKPSRSARRDGRRDGARSRRAAARRWRRP